MLLCCGVCPWQWAHHESQGSGRVCELQAGGEVHQQHACSMGGRAGVGAGGGQGCGDADWWAEAGALPLSQDQHEAAQGGCSPKYVNMT